MRSTPTYQQLLDDLRLLGIGAGDTVMVRATLSAVGKIRRAMMVDALMESVGEDGTIMSLAFTSGVRPWRVAHAEPFTSTAPTYAGALPNAMLAHPSARRSEHPQTSFVAIGRQAEVLTADHGANSEAYAPVRRLMALGGKMALLGCVATSPGFTTTHVAEADLGMCWRLLPAWWFSQSRYVDSSGKVQVFKRRDGGFCSNSYWRFYAEYVRRGVLRAGFVGQAYSILAAAKNCYEIEKAVLARDPRFNVCDSVDCFTCNVQRLDRWHHMPRYLMRRLLRRRDSATG